MNASDYNQQMTEVIQTTYDCFNKMMQVYMSFLPKILEMNMYKQLGIDHDFGYVNPVTGEYISRRKNA